MLNKIESVARTKIQKITSSLSLNHVMTNFKNQMHYPHDIRVIQALMPWDLPLKVYWNRVLFKNGACFLQSAIMNFYNHHVLSEKNPLAVIKNTTQQEFFDLTWPGIISSTSAFTVLGIFRRMFFILLVRKQIRCESMLQWTFRFQVDLDSVEIGSDVKGKFLTIL